MIATAATSALQLDAGTVSRFRNDGFTVIRGLYSPDEVACFRAASLALSARDSNHLVPASDAYRRAFIQVVNPWRSDPVIRAMTLHPRLVAAATQLAGRRIRLWHDQILTKEPNNGQASEFHQDQPYWPMGRAVDAFAAWIALGDTPEEHGCMRFISGSQRFREVPTQHLTVKGHLFELCPEMRFLERVTVPLHAGDVTFHTGFTGHEAGPNQLGIPRVAHSVIFVEATARYQGGGHCVTDPYNLSPGDDLPEDICPRLEA